MLLFSVSKAALRADLAPETGEPQVASFAGDLTKAGPDPEQDGVARWRRKDFARRIEAEFGVVLHERTVGKQLSAIGFHRLSAGPQHPKSDGAAQDVYKKTFQRR